jgi:tetratricopeptide (TPR) repeat protein
MHRWVWAACAGAWISSFAEPSAAAVGGSSLEVEAAQSGVTTVGDLPALVAGENAQPPSVILNQAKELLAAGKPAEAYELLAPYELALAGAPDFDYLLGVAALESRHPKDAAFALERVIVAEPEFLGARLDLARAQLESGEYALARSQFQYLLTQEPPQETRVIIQRYLDSMGARSSRFGSRWSGQAQFGAGYDSNANGSTHEQSFLGFTLDPRNIEMASSFGELTLDGGHILALSPTFGIISNGQLTHRANTEASFIDQSVASLGSTAVWVHGAYRFTGGVDGYASWLDAEDHERGINFNVGASRQFGDYEGAVSLRAGTLEYRQDSLRILDADRYLAGVSVTRTNIGVRAARAGVALLVGADEAKQAGSPYGNDRYGVRLFGSMAVRPDATAYAELSGIRTRYDGSFFGATRDDDQLGLTVALDLQNFPWRRWSVTPRLRYVKNDSNVSLYEYNRFEAVVFVRRAF